MPFSLPSLYSLKRLRLKIARNPRLLVGALFILVMVGAAVVWAVGLLRSSSSDSSLTNPRNFLPFAQEGEQSIVEPTPTQTTEAPRTTTQPKRDATQPQATGYNFAVTVKYSRTPQFSLQIEETKHTSENPTIHLYRPTSDVQPYSTLRLLNRNNQVIREEKFVVSTGGILEGPDTPHQTIQLQESTAYLVVSIPLNASVARVELLSQTGTVLDEAMVSGQQTRASEESPSLAWRAYHAAKSFIQSLPVQAQQARVFTIVVINEAGTSSSIRSNTANSARAILSISPWSRFSDRVVVREINNSDYLGCNIGVGNPNTCANDAAVISRVSQEVPEWDAIIVANSWQCNCGYVGQGFPPITSVGAFASRELIVHELGHSIGKMIDEYLYLGGNTSATVYGPNCFDSQQACLEANEPYQDDPAAQCSLGCTTVFQWRPSTRIMHNSYSPLEFGPFEECVMYNRLANILGETDDEGCTISGGDSGKYWGWRR